MPIAALGTILFAGCSGGGGGNPAPRVVPSATAASAAPAAKTSVSFTIRIPYAVATGAPNSLTRKPLYISPSTKSIAITVGSLPPVSTDLTPSSPNCSTPVSGTLQCTVTEYVDGGTTALFAVKSYDQTGGMGNVLSDASAQATIVAGQANTIPLTLNGDVARIFVTASPVPACVATSEPIVVTAEDADNNIIVGPGVYSNPITLSDSNGTNTTISTTAIDKPGDGATITYSGKSPGYAVINASATGVASTSITPLVFSPGPTVCQEYSIIGTVQPANPLGITVGSDGDIYAAEYGWQGLAMIAEGAAAGTLPMQVPFAASGGIFFKATGIATGSDKNLWVTDPNNGLIRVTPGATAATTPVLYADGGTQGAQEPIGIVNGPDGNLWVAEDGTNAISKVTTAGVYTDYPVTSANAQPFGIAVGGDGRLWFTEKSGNRIGAITTSGVVSEWTIPTADSLPTFITPGPGLHAGDPPGLWFSESGAGQLGFITTSNPTITEFAAPATSVAIPEGIVAGLDGNIYYADNGEAQLGRIAPQTGVFTTFPLMTITGQTADTPAPYALTLGTDGNIYFTDSSVTDGTTSLPATYTGALGYFAY